MEYIARPTLLLDEAKCITNIRRMAHKARENGVLLRPHFKTHQSRDIGRFFQDFGVDSVTVSSVPMAQYFAAASWSNITIAFPVNLRELPGINQLAGKVRLNVLVDSAEVVKRLSQGLHHQAGVFIEIDTGGGRSGAPPANKAHLQGLISEIKKSPNLEFRGFLTHAGQTYEARGEQAILQIHTQSTALMAELKNYFSSENPIISTGDTPSCSLANEFGCTDEIRPGNFVFYDLTQHYIGSCALEDVAVAVACPVVAKYASRNELVICGGAIHLSKDFAVNSRGVKVFGRLALLDDDHWKALPEGNELISLSQEHGVARMEEKYIKLLSPGDLVCVIPAHSCLTVALHSQYQGLSGRQYDIMQR